MLRIIHTSDVHLGAKFLSFGKKAKVQRQALQDVFAKTVDLAISSKANILLIAGDLFDSNFPSYPTVNFVKQQFRKLNEAKVYVALVPGTHDCLNKESIYRREDFKTGLPYIHIFDTEEAHGEEFPDIELTVFAKANTSNKSTESPVAFLAAAAGKAKTKYKVAMAHGSVQVEGKSAPDDLPITLPQIADSGMQYLALGHWHGAQEFSFGSTVAWYAGSPEITYQEGKGGLGQGHVLRVDITDKVSVTPEKVTEKAVKEMQADMQVYENMENVIHEIEKLANPNVVLSVTLSGLADPSEMVDTERIEEECRDKFFALKVKSAVSYKMPEHAEMEYPEEFVIGQFVRIMQEKLKNVSSDEERSIIEDALHTGLAELQGRNVV